MADDYKDLISEGEDFDGTVVLADEEGNEISFTFLDLLEYEGESYVLLLPTQEDLANEVVILRVTEENGAEFYEAVEDLETIEAVFALFQQLQEENKA
ncbi:MAG TPA: DUF1292 domain-containing protein [Candidatus Fimivicinus intestinavium]|nr:DUF1292 domain-containing protein [Candidatus Fimivicinus intestinavium]